ncbi:hypothetical protein O181_066406 [Austropuccinia psidii MF-1]|uniref:Retrovirus-related Pol polyprotein from transposon TNT 1-94-like beta-barrel domain-containing protein n=1 Tax=Austropuccinia psidii MF-1 TaxID=1389203 RepID=A0A9Q3I263_9BASI|nr:hypothetical protein [Austropuccinia psidii MF-1]
MEASSRADRKFGAFKQGISDDSNKPRQQLNTRSKDWILKHILPSKPCFWCFEWGHWKQYCPIRLACKPKQADSQLKDPAVKLKKSSFLSHPALAKVDFFEDNLFFEAHVAAVEDMKVFAELVLLYSGATHNVTNNQSLFQDFQPINISLSVATAEKYPVVRVGTVVFGVDGGQITLKKALYCIVCGEVNFVHGIFQLVQGSITYCSWPCKDRWFIKILTSPACHAIKDAKGWLFWDTGRQIFVRGALVIFDEAGGMSGCEGNAEIVKVIEATRIAESSMIDKIEGQDTVFSLMLMNVGVKSGAPMTYEEALASTNKALWEAAMKDELSSLEDMGVWEEVFPPERGVYFEDKYGGGGGVV